MSIVPGGSVRRRLPRFAAFVAAALTFFVTMTAAGVPSPLYVVYEDRWGFPVAILALTFAIYAFGLLASLLVFGSLSDFIGRRPVIIGALVLDVIAMAVFVLAPDIGWIIVARVIQGVATGAATSALSATLVDLAPEGNKGRGALVGSVSGPSGLAVGALVTGFGVQFWPGVTTIVFVALAVLMVVAIVAVVAMPESTAGTPGALRSLIPRAGVPLPARRAFIAVLPAQIAGWMMAGLFLGLAPSIVRDVLHLDSGLVNGLVVFAQTSMTALGGLILGRASGRRSTVVGCIALAAGAGVVVLSILQASLPLLVIGAIVSGFGVGGAYAGSLRVVAPLAPPHERAELFAASYIVAYLAFGVPSLIGGQFVALVGLLAVAALYSAVILVFAAVGVVAQAATTGRTGHEPR